MVTRDGTRCGSRERRPDENLIVHYHDLMARKKKSNKVAKTQPKPKSSNNNPGGGGPKPPSHTHQPTRSNNPGYAANRGDNPQAEAYTVAQNISSAAALDIMLPSQRPKCRYADQFAATPTAPSAPWKQITTPWSDAVDTMNIFVFRDVLCACIFNDPNTSARAYQYNLELLDNEDATGLINAPPSQAAIIKFNTPDSVLPLHGPRAAADPLYSFAPHGEFLAAASVTQQDFRAFWMDAGATATITVDNQSGAPATLTLILDRHTKTEGLQEQFEDQMSPGAIADGGEATWSVTVTEEGYYAFKLGSDIDGNYIVSLSIHGNGPVWCHQSINKFWTKAQWIGSTRIKGAAVQYTNTAAPTYRAGQCAQFQVPSQYDWRNLKTYDDVVKLNGVVPREVKDGAYSYLKPKSDKDFEPVTLVTLNPYDEVMDGFFELRDRGDFLVIALSIPQQTAGAPSPKSGYYKIYHSLEFQSSDPWADLDLPTALPDDWKQALLLIKFAQQHFENPTHFKDVMRELTKGIAKYAPHVIKGAQMVGKLL